MATILALSDALGLPTTTGTLAMMLGLAVGIDYALFVRDRAQLVVVAYQTGLVQAAPPAPPTP